MRQTEGAVLCASCRRLVHVDEEVCPHCGARRPGLFGFGPVLLKVFGRVDLAFFLVAASVVLYTLSLGVDLGRAYFSFDVFSAGAPSSRALMLLGMTGGESWARGWLWTLLTASFLHGSAVHIAFNMMWLRTLAPEVEEAFGTARFLVLYLLTGVGGFLLSNVASGAPTIGASCSVFGLMGALYVWGRRRGGTHGRGLSRTMLIWAAIGGGMGFMMPGINNWGHAGGFLAGLLLGAVLPLAGREKEGPGMMILALLLVLGTVVGVGLSVALTLPHWARL